MAYKNDLIAFLNKLNDQFFNLINSIAFDFQIVWLRLNLFLFYFSVTQTSLAAGSEATLVDVKPNSKINSRRRKMSNPDSTDVPDYRNKRDRNNIAVRKSREKAKEQQKMAKERVDYLRKENKLLESKVAQLQSELKLCRNMFIKSGAQVPEVLEKALKDM